MGEIAVSVRNVSKEYVIAAVNHTTLRDHLVHAWRSLSSRSAEPHAVTRAFRALNEVSFDVTEGEVLGIIGHNGAGKSTLLKILSRITEPSAGEVDLYGRVTSLLEVGTGFHAELTGRENVYLNAAMLGMRKTDINRRFDEIVDFSGTARFIDTPVKRYSSGMYVRLAFSVAAHLDPEILIVDEVLSVGDGAFQKKCLGKMDEVRRDGRTVILVSHDLPVVAGLCQRAILLRQGTVVGDGRPQQIIEQYMSEAYSGSGASLADRKDRYTQGELMVQSITFHNEKLETVQPALSGQHLVIRVHYASHVRKVFKEMRVMVVLNRDERTVCILSTDLVDRTPLHLEGNGYVDFHLPHLPLCGGRYFLHVAIENNTVTQDWVQYAAELQVLDGDYYGTGKMYPHDGWRGKGMFVDHSWSMTRLS
ncbi:MAG: Teichoic acid export ATP-binding protein TagH [Nitrospira sp.]|jgi:lipopolysaccharide transport system ATP-binding protein|nr:MAG: Teichoic acid export ATP-binding protein TagH [Nitrospira sp.]